MVPLTRKFYLQKTNERQSRLGHETISHFLKGLKLLRHDPETRSSGEISFFICRKLREKKVFDL